MADGGTTASMTRRGFMLGTAGAAATSATGAASAQESGGNNSSGGGGGSGPAQTFKFGGKIQGWQGPKSFQGPKTNPTLSLQAGQTYKVTWKNLDGASHDFTINSSGGSTITSTKQMSSQGQTLSLTFTASPDMAEYICTVHPTTMVGKIQVSGGGGGGGSSEPAVPRPAKTLGVITSAALTITLGITYFFIKYGGDYGEFGEYK